MSPSPGGSHQKGVSLKIARKKYASLLTQVQFRSHLFCTWGAEGAAALKIPEMTIFQSRAFLVEGAGGKVIESVKSSNPCTDLGRFTNSNFSKHNWSRRHFHRRHPLRSFLQLPKLGSG